MEDILSRLPDQILDRILCFLPQKEAVRTCVLSQSWRHLGSSRSKLELCHVTDFKSHRKKFLSHVMYNTIRRYNHHHPLKQLSLKLSYATFRLDLPWITSEAPLLEELYLKNWNLRRILRDHKSRPVFNHLRKLSLVGCDITEEKLEVFLSSTTCPLLECLCIDPSSGFKNLNVGKARRLKHLEISHYYDLSSIQLDAPSTLETIRIEHCRDWRFLDNDNYFPRLNSICLKNVGLKSETFNFFTSKYMPSLEKLELDRCYGCQEFQLSNSSIKYLSIICFKGATKVTIDAPNLSCFKLKPYHPLPSLSFTPIRSCEWKSHVNLTTDVRNDRYDHSAPCLGIFHEIHRVLKSLSESQITLQLFLGNEYQRRILDAAHEGL